MPWRSLWLRCRSSCQPGCTRPTWSRFAVLRVLGFGGVLGVRVLGFGGLGFRDFGFGGFRVLGFRVLGFGGLGFQGLVV